MCRCALVKLLPNRSRCAGFFLRYNIFLNHEFYWEVKMVRLRQICPSVWIIPLLYLGWCHQCSAVMIQVYFRGLIHRRRWQGDLLGNNPDHCTERVFVWVGPTHVLLGPFLSPVTSQSLLWPVGAGRLNVMTPFSSPLCPLRTLQPINFHSAFTQIPWFPPPALISNTCPRDTKTHTQRASLLKLGPH